MADQESGVCGITPGVAREATPAYSSADALFYASGCICLYYFVVSHSFALLAFACVILARSATAVEKPLDHKDFG